MTVAVPFAKMTGAAAVGVAPLGLTTKAVPLQVTFFVPLKDVSIALPEVRAVRVTCWEAPAVQLVGALKESCVAVATGAAVVIDSGALAVWPSASVTWTVKDTVPAVVGVPEMTPALLRLSPVGSAPEVTAHAYGAAPPLALKLWE